MRSHAKEKQIHIAAVLPAAGSSTRMGMNKLLLPLHDVPVLAHTLLAFEQCPLIESIVIVCREQDIMPYRQLATAYSCTKVQYIVRGGKTRTESVLAGISACADSIDLVAIHDGARPLVPVDVIQGDLIGQDILIPGIPLRQSLAGGRLAVLVVVAVCGVKIGEATFQEAVYHPLHRLHIQCGAVAFIQQREPHQAESQFLHFVSSSRSRTY